MKTIAVDLVPIRIGEGGTGSGIWTYARELLLSIDQSDLNGLKVVALVNEDQVEYLPLQKIHIQVFKSAGKSILRRLYWVHCVLPLWCWRNKVYALHKVATETPWFCPAKRITTIHDFYYEYLYRQRYKNRIRLYERMEHAYFMFVTKLCIRKSQALIAVSQATRQEAIKRYPECAERIHVVRHGSPVLEARASGDPHQTARRAVLPPRSAIDGQVGNDRQNQIFNILCVAKFMEHKGQHLLIEAFEKLLRSNPQLQAKVRLLMRGFHNDSDYFAAIQQQVYQSDFHDAICIKPYDADLTIEQIYTGADLVALLSDYEGFGLPVLEAQACGIPVLCSDLGVLREVGGAGAVYLPRSDTEKIAGAMYRLVTDKKYREELRQAARKNVARFDWGLAASKTLKIYRMY